jgi:hypothetical protein
LFCALGFFFFFPETSGTSGAVSRTMVGLCFNSFTAEKKRILTSNRASVQIISEFKTLKKHRMDKHLNRQLRVEAAVGF